METRKLALAILLASSAPACSTVGEGAGGNGGGAGAGGVGGITSPLCVAATSACEIGTIDPIVEDPSCTIGKPPVQPSACDGGESLENPASCPPTGNTRSYQLTLLEIAEDCNLGYDLDGCNGNSCMLGDIAPGEGANGVDNALAGLALFLEPFGNLGGVSQAFYDAICEGRLDVRLVVDDNGERGCVSMTTFVDGENTGTRLFNRSGDGCLSGSLGSISLTLGGGITRKLDNVVLRATLTNDGLSDGIAGTTLDRATAVAIAQEFIGGPASALVPRLLDIDDSLQRDPEEPCDALSVTLRLGGVPSP